MGSSRDIHSHSLRDHVTLAVATILALMLAFMVLRGREYVHLDGTALAIAAWLFGVAMVGVLLVVAAKEVYRCSLDEKHRVEASRSLAFVFGRIVPWGLLGAAALFGASTAFVYLDSTKGVVWVEGVTWAYLLTILFLVYLSIVALGERSRLAGYLAASFWVYALLALNVAGVLPLTCPTPLDNEYVFASIVPAEEGASGADHARYECHVFERRFWSAPIANLTQGAHASKSAIDARVQAWLPNDDAPAPQVQIPLQTGTTSAPPPPPPSIQ